MPGQRLFSQLLFDRVVWHYGVRVNNVKVQNVEVDSTDMQHRWIIARHARIHPREIPWTSTRL